MATQHPDNADKPYWHPQPFISTAAEIRECFICFSDLGIDEYNWDWEGKFVDEAVVDKLLHRYYDYFKKHRMGKDKYLTFRIPNPRVEKQFRLARALMVIITSSQLAQSLGFDNPPIFETILPLTETAEEIIDIQEAFRTLIQIDHKLLKMTGSIKDIEIIPLFEQVEKIIDSANIIREYFRLYKKKFGKTPIYLRPYCARSDPALNSGLVPTILAFKIALSSYLDLGQELGASLYPMLGTGSLPFRGGLSPENIDGALDEYAGVSTITLQGAFRYDYEKEKVKNAVAKLEKELPKRKQIKLDSYTKKAILSAIPLFEKPYRRSIENMAPLINSMSSQVVRRRERMQHIGLFGYSRGIGKIRLPRAIPFTASLYSLGIPPEIIGVGRGIRQAKKKGLWSEIKPIYIHLKDDLAQSGYFVNKKNIIRLAKHRAFWYDIIEDITLIEKEFNIQLGPKSPSHEEHFQLAEKIYERIKKDGKVSHLITRGGILRKSLG